ncbi:MAG: SGNH/GDSL hydrolase family protein [Acidimicrobiales bacterium]
MSWRGASRLLASLLLTGAVVPVIALSVSAPAGADAPARLAGFYLDLGASASVGYQPTDTAPHGEATTDGYANDIVSYEADRGVTLDLTELGCPGETTTTMVNGDDHCYHEDGSQLADAMSFLRAHDSYEGIVTVDLGFNDIRHCLDEGSLSESCVDTKIDLLQEQLPFILQSLQGAAGPDVSFVGVGHYDPYLADAISGKLGARFASHSEAVIDHLNDALSTIYADADIPMATVSDFFDGQSRAPVDLEGVGLVADNVAHACELTWMCAPKPYGPNMHPNDAGYLAIASAIESKLETPW